MMNDPQRKPTPPSPNYEAEAVRERERMLRSQALEMATRSGFTSGIDAVREAEKLLEFLNGETQEPSEPERCEVSGVVVGRPSQAPSKAVHPQVTDSKQFRKDLDEILQRLKAVTVSSPFMLVTGERPRTSRHRDLAIQHLEDAIMRLGMDLKVMREQGLTDEPSPYPESYNPDSATVEKTAGGLQL